MILKASDIDERAIPLKSGNPVADLFFGLRHHFSNQGAKLF
jgi:hypothetical protein